VRHRSPTASPTRPALNTAAFLGLPVDLAEMRLEEQAAIVIGVSDTTRAMQVTGPGKGFELVRR
jgi:hypothetical protein